MIEPTLLDYVPLWAFFLITVGFMIGAGEGGHRFGRYRGQKSDSEKEGPTGTIAGATLGLLAFLLAFTFGLAASRYDSRREVFQEELNAIGTTYLRAEFLPGDQGPKVRTLLRKYVDTRLEVHQPNVQIDEVIRSSEKLHKELWTEAVKAGRKDNSDIIALFVESLNQVIDLHSKRVAAATRARVPASIWGALILLSIVSAASLSYQCGLAGSARSIAALGLVLCFATVMVLIADLDRPHDGIIRVNPQGMIDLRESMKTIHPE